MSLRERLAREGVLQDKAGDDAKGGGAGDDAKDDDALQPGPGETLDSVRGLKVAKGDDDDRGDEVKAAADAKAAEEKAAADKKAADDKVAYDALSDEEKAAADKKAADDKSGDDDIGGIPKSRLDAVLKRARTAEAEARKLRAEAKPEPDPKDDKDDDDGSITVAQAQDRLEELDVEIAKTVKSDEDEDGAKLALLIREQRELQEGVRDARMEEMHADSSRTTSEEIQFDRVVTELEENIPQLNPDHADYDDDMAQETVTLAHALRAQGRTQGDAMLLAVGYMANKLGIDEKDVKDVKLKTDVAKNVDLAKKLPPDLPGMKGSSSDKGGLTGGPADGVRMDDAEFDALRADEERFKILRGDIL